MSDTVPAPPPPSLAEGAPWIAPDLRARLDALIASLTPAQRARAPRTFLVGWIEAEARYSTAARMQAQIDQGTSLKLLTKDKHGNPVPSPYLAVMSGAMADLTRIARCLGFHPGERTEAATKRKA